jgi:hypothetical protein
MEIKLEPTGFLGYPISDKPSSISISGPRTISIYTSTSPFRINVPESPSKDRKGRLKTTGMVEFMV